MALPRSPAPPQATVKIINYAAEIRDQSRLFRVNLVDEPLVICALPAALAGR
jgi:hypothetical protein